MYLTLEAAAYMSMAALVDLLRPTASPHIYIARRPQVGGPRAADERRRAVDEASSPIPATSNIPLVY